MIIFLDNSVGSHCESGLGSIYQSNKSTPSSKETRLQPEAIFTANHTHLNSTFKSTNQDRTINSASCHFMENQYEKQFERRDKSEQNERNFKKYYYNEENLNYRSIRSPRMTSTKQKECQNGNVMSDDEDTIKSVYSETQSIRTEDFSNVFNKYIALTNKNLEMHDRYL